MPPQVIDHSAQPPETAPPRFGVQRAAQAGGKLPREVDGCERAVGGAKRFKIRCNNYGSHIHRYILAADEKTASECYLDLDGINIEMASLKKRTGEEPPAPVLVVKEMSD